MHEARDKWKYRRIEVISGRRQRRNWTDKETARILAESAEADVNISAVAQRWGAVAVIESLLSGARGNGIEPALQAMKRAEGTDFANISAERRVEIDVLRFTGRETR